MQALEALEALDTDIYAMCTQRLAFEMLTVYAKRELDSLHAKARAKGLNIEGVTVRSAPQTWRQMLRSGIITPQSSAPGSRASSVLGSVAGQVVMAGSSTGAGTAPHTEGHRDSLVEAVRLARSTVFDTVDHPALKQAGVDTPDEGYLSGNVIQLRSKIQVRAPSGAIHAPLALQVVQPSLTPMVARSPQQRVHMHTACAP